MYVLHAQVVWFGYACEITKYQRTYLRMIRRTPPEDYKTGKRKFNQPGVNRNECRYAAAVYE